MAILTLPKFRWLFAGAIAAAFWAVTQEPPSSRQPDRPAKAVERNAKAAKPRNETIESVITSSIPRPQKPVGAQERPRLMHTISKVRLREKASTSSAIVTMLKGAQPVRVIASEGVWKKVTVGEHRGWVHGDYLTAGLPEAEHRPDPVKTAVARPDAMPRPPEKLTPRPITEAAKPSGGPLWGALRPARPPQGGDCQCPYDLMLSGKECGDHSAFARKGGDAVQCYF